MNESKRAPLWVATTAVLLALAAAGCAGSARGGGRTAGPDLFAGTWAGTFEADDFGGEMELVLTFAEDAWSGTMTVHVMDESVGGEISSFEFEENTCTFTTFIAGGDLVFMGTVAEGKMTGTFEVYVEGNYADGGTFTFTRQ